MKFRIAAILAAIVLLGGATHLAFGQSSAGGTTREFTECAECPQMVGIAAGKFLMGSPAHEPGRFDSEGPQHAVTGKAFALRQYPVPSAEYPAVLNATGYHPHPHIPCMR